MNKILYVVNDNENKDYKYNIDEDTIIYHFSINSSSNVYINMVRENVKLTYYYSNINYDDNYFNISVNHISKNTHSEVYNHGVNVLCNHLDYRVDGIVGSDSSGCICNQDNQIINLDDGKSTIMPNLLIDNYDVDSNHAAYIGKFKDEIIFYLMSRGISRSGCYNLLMRGFLIGDYGIDENKISKFIECINNI